MYRAEKLSNQDQQEFYGQLNKLLLVLIQEEPHWLANLANAAGLLFDQLEEINWAGFYLLDDGQLVLGPYQGKPACTRIPLGKGVCGTSAREKQTVVVPDVHQFPGHIACDAMSKSEIVIPLMLDGELVGVLDIDSPITDRFNQHDVTGLEEFVSILEQHIKGIRG